MNPDMALCRSLGLDDTVTPGDTVGCLDQHSTDSCLSPELQCGHITGEPGHPCGLWQQHWPLTSAKIQAVIVYIF